LPVEVWQESYGRTALEVNVLTRILRDVPKQVDVLTSPPCAQWFTEAEVSNLRRLYEQIQAAGDAAEEWEKAWRARLESFPKS
jgi:hypothetical protein